MIHIRTNRQPSRRAQEKQRTKRDIADFENSAKSEDKEPIRRQRPEKKEPGERTARHMPNRDKIMAPVQKEPAPRKRRYQEKSKIEMRIIPIPGSENTFKAILPDGSDVQSLFDALRGDDPKKAEGTVKLAYKDKNASYRFSAGIFTRISGTTCIADLLGIPVQETTIRKNNDGTLDCKAAIAEQKKEEPAPRETMTEKQSKGGMA